MTVVQEAVLLEHPFSAVRQEQQRKWIEELNKQIEDDRQKKAEEKIISSMVIYKVSLRILEKKLNIFNHKLKSILKLHDKIRIFKLFHICSCEPFLNEVSKCNFAQFLVTCQTFPNSLIFFIFCKLSYLNVCGINIVQFC